MGGGVFLFYFLFLQQTDRCFLRQQRFCGGSSRLKKIQMLLLFLLLLGKKQLLLFLPNTQMNRCFQLWRPLDPVRDGGEKVGQGGVWKVKPRVQL